MDWTASSDTLGETYHGDQKIQVANRLKGAAKAEVLLHELLHVVFAIWSMDRYHNHEAEENIVNTMGHGLTTLMRDNPKLFEYLLQLVKDDS